jgi:hypothetical protein
MDKARHVREMQSVHALSGYITLQIPPCVQPTGKSQNPVLLGFYIASL